MPSQSRSEALGYDEIDANTCFWSKELPDLGRVQDLKLPFRIYVLACEPRMFGGPRTIYTGLSTEAQIACRIRTDFGQGPLALHFCQTYAPRAVLGVWPAANPAAEAFAFYALVGQRGEKVLASGALGGWT